MRYFSPVHYTWSKVKEVPYRTLHALNCILQDLKVMALLVSAGRAETGNHRATAGTGTAKLPQLSQGCRAGEERGHGNICRVLCSTVLSLERPLEKYGVARQRCLTQRMYVHHRVNAPYRQPFRRCTVPLYGTCHMRDKESVHRPTAYSTV